MKRITKNIVAMLLLAAMLITLVVLYDYERRISELAEELVEPIDNLFKGGTSIELIYRYLSCCDIEQYKQIENEAVAFFENLAREERRRGIASLKEKLQEVQRRSEGTRKDGRKVGGVDDIDNANNATRLCEVQLAGTTWVI